MSRRDPLSASRVSRPTRKNWVGPQMPAANRGGHARPSAFQALSQKHRTKPQPHSLTPLELAPSAQGIKGGWPIRCSRQLPADHSNVRSRSSEPSTAQPTGANSTLSTQNRAPRGGELISFALNPPPRQNYPYPTKRGATYPASSHNPRLPSPQNGRQNHLLDRLRYIQPPQSSTDYSEEVLIRLFSRPRRPRLAAGHRDAALLHQEGSLGVPRLRRRRCELRVLAAGSGRAADQAAAGAEAGYPREAGAEGGAGGERCCGRAQRGSCVSGRRREKRDWTVDERSGEGRRLLRDRWHYNGPCQHDLGHKADSGWQDKFSVQSYF